LRFHRGLADALAAEAVRDIDREPHRKHDWSLLAVAS
jgi:hypothetical protein